MAGTLSTPQPEKILKELEALWSEMGRSDADRPNAVLRACAMTLLVGLDQDDDTQAAGQTVAELMHEHPSRAIVLKIGWESSGVLEARVLAQCWMPFGRRQQICCEQIEIEASFDRIEEVPRIIMGVTVPDLPVVLWCRSPRLCSDPGFQRLFPLIDKLILDSAVIGDPSQGLRFVRHLSGMCVVADLNWARVTPWREMVSLLFEEPENRGLAGAVKQVKIRHGGAVPPVAAIYLAEWLRATLPARAEVAFDGGDGRGQEPVRAIEMSGPEVEASVVLEGSCAVLNIQGRRDRVPFPALTDVELLRVELSIQGRDPIFERSLR